MSESENNDIQVSEQKKKRKLEQLSPPLKIGGYTYYTYKQKYLNKKGKILYRNITIKRKNKSAYNAIDKKNIEIKKKQIEDNMFMTDYESNQ
uniref:Uncharacterized protein n=1 Tax=Pithovirus LCPAC001 TaxID=2506585 RepID=A0A481Z2M1_9VIRU|nr:MAG: hypothetical protein LCPAC001_02300 [Pithovirus LCPAC001]